MSIRQQKEDYDRFKLLMLTTPVSDNKLPGAVEDMAREVYNNSQCVIRFTSTHPEKHRMYFHGKPPLYWNVLECHPGEWVFLPHGMWDFTCTCKGTHDFTTNIGDAMFKGNTLPSRPEEMKIRSFPGRPTRG
jgi:hypothetical protein